MSDLTVEQLAELKIKAEAAQKNRLREVYAHQPIGYRVAIEPATVLALVDEVLRVRQALKEIDSDLTLGDTWFEAAILRRRRAHQALGRDTEPTIRKLSEADAHTDARTGYQSPHREAQG